MARPRASEVAASGRGVLLRYILHERRIWSLCLSHSNFLSHSLLIMNIEPIHTNSKKNLPFKDKPACKKSICIYIYVH